MKKYYFSLLLVIFSITAYSQVLTLPGLVAYYPVSSLPGKVFKDATNSFEGTFTTNTTFAGNRFGTLPGAALVGYNGGSGHYAVVNNDLTITGINTLSGFSLSFWVKPMATFAGGSMALFSFLNNMASGYDIVWNGGSQTLSFHNYTVVNSNFTVSSTETLKAGVWQMLTVAIDPDQKSLQVYINDKIVIATTTSIAFTNPASKALYFGKNLQSSPLYSLDDAQLYNRILTAAEVKKVYFNCVSTVASPVIVNDNKFICSPGDASYDFNGGVKYAVYASSFSGSAMATITTSASFQTASYLTQVPVSPSSIWVAALVNGCESERVEARIRISYEKLEIVIEDTTGRVGGSEYNNYKKISFKNKRNVDFKNIYAFVCNEIVYPECRTDCKCARIEVDGSWGSNKGVISRNGVLYIEEVQQTQPIKVAFYSYNDIIYDSCNAKLDGKDTLYLTSRGPVTQILNYMPFSKFTFKNPVEDILHLSSQDLETKRIKEISIINNMGVTFKVLYTKNNNTLQIDMSNYLPGFYIVTILYDDGHNGVYKIIKE